MNHLFYCLIIHFLQIINSSKCPENWVSWGGKCYIFHADQEGITFYEAISLCRNVFHAQLVSINSAEEQEFVSHYAFKKHSAEYHIWLGAIRSDHNKSGHFQWMDGSKFKYTNWAESEPNFNHEKQHCLVMGSGDDGKWYDFWCTSWCFTVCERHISHTHDLDVENNIIYSDANEDDMDDEIVRVGDEQQGIGTQENNTPSYQYANEKIIIQSTDDSILNVDHSNSSENLSLDHKKVENENETNWKLFVVVAVSVLFFGLSSIMVFVYYKYKRPGIPFFDTFLRRGSF